MKKYSLSQFQLSPLKEQEFIEKVILDGILEKRVLIEGVKYLEFSYPETGERVLVEEKIETFYEGIVYDILNDLLKKGDVEGVVDTFRVAIKRFFNKEKIEEILSKADKTTLKNIYINYRGSLKERGIDICKYISPNTLYQDLLLNLIDITKTYGKSREVNIVGTAVKEIKEVLDAEVEACGGLESWIEKRGLTKRKSNNIYAKDRLLENVLNDGDVELKRKYATLLIKVGFSSKDLYSLIRAGEITPDVLTKIYSVPELTKIVIESVGKFDTFNAIVSFVAVGDDDVLNKFNWNKVTAEELREIADKIEELTATDITFFIIKMYQSIGKRLSEKEIDMIFENKGKDRFDIIRAYFELAKQGLYTEDKLIELFEGEIEEENTENPYEVKFDKRVSLHELLTLFTPDKVISKVEGYYNSDEERAEFDKIHLLCFYYALLEATKIARSDDVKLIKDELQTKLKQRIQEGNFLSILVAMELFEDQILEIERIKEILGDEDMMLDLYSNGIDDSVLLYLYTNKIVSKDLIELVYEGMTREELTERLQNNQLTPANLATLYFLGVIGAEQLEEGDFSTIDWISIIKQCDGVDITSKIALLYKNGHINFEDIKQLKEDKIIGAKEAELILNQLDLEDIFTNGLTSPEGVGDGRKRRKREERVKSKGIPLEDRDELFEALGFSAITDKDGETLVVADGSFKGYRVYRDTQRNFGVIVFENDSDGSSFIMHEAKAGEFIKAASNAAKKATLLGSRSYWRERARTDGSVTAKLHTVQWGRNIIDAIVDASSTFKFDDEEERRKYVKTETGRLCEKHKDTIEYIRLLKQEQLAK